MLPYSFLSLLSSFFSLWTCCIICLFILFLCHFRHFAPLPSPSSDTFQSLRRCVNSFVSTTGASLLLNCIIPSLSFPFLSHSGWEPNTHLHFLKCVSYSSKSFFFGHVTQPPLSSSLLLLLLFYYYINIKLLSPRISILCTRLLYKTHIHHRLLKPASKFVWQWLGCRRFGRWEHSGGLLLTAVIIALLSSSSPSSSLPLIIIIISRCCCCSTTIIISLFINVGSVIIIYMFECARPFFFSLSSSTCIYI